MNAGPLITVIMPAYNSGKYIAEAIGSVLKQSYSNFELLVINDGSTDNTKEVVMGIKDPRIRYFEQQNKGVSGARNKGLENMKGEFFSFFDSDDILPVRSLEARYRLLEADEKIWYADGRVELKNHDLTVLRKTYRPDFHGNPFYEILKFNGKCFLGQTWMIRRKAGQVYRFDESLSHGEEVLFYLSFCKEGLYTYTDENILVWRMNAGSAMHNLPGLARGYDYLIRNIKKNVPLKASAYLKMKLKITSIMFKSFLKEKQVLNAFFTVFRYIFV